MDPFIGEIRIFAGNFAPLGWAFCDGSPQNIADNDALYALIGTTYGGDGQNTFNLPDLRGRLPLHMGTDRGGNGYVLGQRAGTESVTLTANQMPQHSHQFQANPAAATSPSPSNAVPAQPAAIFTYFAGSPSAPLSAQMIGLNGNSQPHDNHQPSLGINFIIAMEGIFPSQN